MQYFPHKFPFTAHQGLNSTVSYAKNKFDKQTSLNVRDLCLIFQHIFQPHLSIYPSTHAGQTLRENRLHRRRNSMAARSFLINDTSLITSKLLTPNMHCWSSKTLVPIHCMRLRVNGICAKYFRPKKTNNNGTMFLMECFQWQRLHI